MGAASPIGDDQARAGFAAGVEPGADAPAAAPADAGRRGALPVVSCRLSVRTLIPYRLVLNGASGGAF